MPTAEVAVRSTPKAHSNSRADPTAMARNQITPLQLSARAFRKPIDVYRNRLSETAEGKASTAIELAEELAPANGLRMCELFCLQFLRLLPVILEKPISWSHTFLFEPIQRLRSRICLIVILALRKRGQFVQILLQPRGFVWNMNKTVFDRNGGAFCASIPERDAPFLPAGPWRARQRAKHNPRLVSNDSS